MNDQQYCQLILQLWIREILNGTQRNLGFQMLMHWCCLEPPWKCCFPELLRMTEIGNIYAGPKRKWTESSTENVCLEKVQRARSLARQHNLPLLVFDNTGPIERLVDNFIREHSRLVEWNEEQYVLIEVRNYLVERKQCIPLLKIWSPHFGKTVGEAWLSLTQSILEHGEKTTDEGRSRLSLQNIDLKFQTLKFQILFLTSTLIRIISIQSSTLTFEGEENVWFFMWSKFFSRSKKLS